MIGYKKFLKENYRILIILSLFFLTEFLILFFQKNVWWDSAVYIGMGKYLFSYGNSGLWEASRPLIWPFILGSFWKLGFNILLFRILGLFFAAGCIYLTYLIAKDFFNKRIALFSALFLAFSPTFYFFSTILLSEIPSLFFALLSVYFFINKRYFLFGIFSGIAFMTKFLQLFMFMAILLIFISCFDKNKAFCKNALKIAIGFFIILAPYLIFNKIIYDNAFYPLILQNFMTKNTGFIFHQNSLFYFVNLLKENYLSITFILGFYLITSSFLLSKNKFYFKQSAIILIFLLFFIFLNSIKHKEMRLFIIVFPYLYIIAAYSLNNIMGKIKAKNILFYLFVILAFSLWSLQSLSGIYALEYNEIQQKNKYIEFQDYLENSYVDEGIWISSPVSAVYTNKKIEELIYYPSFNSEKYNELKNRVMQGKHILIDTCDIMCEPNALTCENESSQFLETLKENYTKIFYNQVENCEQFIFSR